MERRRWRLPAAAVVRLVGLVLTVSGAARADNLLANPSFESGDALPDGWTLAGAGSFLWRDVEPHEGLRAAGLVAPAGAYTLLYQRLPAAPGDRFTLAAWSRFATGGGSADVKLEFHDAAEVKLVEHVRSHTAPSTWGRFFTVGEAPDETASVTATVVASGGMVEFDDLSLSEVPEGSEIVFDLAEASGELLGFGAQVWAHRPTPEWPAVAATRERVLAELGLRYVRIEVLQEGHSNAELRRLRAATDPLGIEWVAMVWSAPSELVDGSGMLADERGFAAWWAGRVADLAAEGIPVEWVEVMNEPDSGGEWSTGIDPLRYDRLVRHLRRRLDQRGFDDVGIVGPGLTSTSWSDSASYVTALSPAGVEALAGWSTHTWLDDSLGAYPEGGVSTEGYWGNLGEHAAARDATLPRFATEYATRQDTFHGTTYRTPDESPWDDALVFPYHNATNTLPYAARVFQQTLALMNAPRGAAVPMLWQLNDEPTEVLEKGKGWGLVDLWGDDKPVAGALGTLLPEISPGSLVVRSPDQAFHPLYAGVLLDGERVVVGVANSSRRQEVATLRLQGVGAGLEVVSAVAYEPLAYGDPSIGQPDVGRGVDRQLTADPGGPGELLIALSLPGDSTLTIVLEPGPGGLRRNFPPRYREDAGAPASIAGWRDSRLVPFGLHR